MADGNGTAVCDLGAYEGVYVFKMTYLPLIVLEEIHQLITSQKSKPVIRAPHSLRTFCEHITD